MDLEEPKKMIENKIEAEALTKNVRRQIKSYIDQKQNLREGFKETFQPLIASQDKVKESIDNQQNAMIKQLQENQLALTEGLDKNRLAITQGFDKMVEVRRSDLDQLPSFEAIEHPEIKTRETEKTEEEPGYLISINDMKLLLGGKESDFTIEDEKLQEISIEEYDEILSQDKLDIDKYAVNMVDQKNRILRVVKRDYREEPKEGLVTFDDSDLNKGLLNKKSDDILKELKLPLPSRIKNRKHEDIKIFQKSAEVHLDFFKDLLSNKAVLYTEKGVNKAKAKSRNPQKDTERQIDHYNVLGIHINNISKLENYAEKTGQGIIHFNNPLQLLNRLELLGGSLNAGNNGVKQEFSQIAHLLHQLKVITKKQLNDLLKKYILNK